MTFWDGVKKVVKRMGNVEPLPEGMNAKEYSLRRKIEHFDRQDRIKQLEEIHKRHIEGEKARLNKTFMDKGFKRYVPPQPKYIEETDFLTGKKRIRKIV